MRRFLYFLILIFCTLHTNAQITTCKLTSVKTFQANRNDWGEPKSCNYNLYIAEKITFIKEDGEHLYTVHSKKETYEKDKYNVFTFEVSSPQDGDCTFRFIFGKYESALIIEYANKRPRELFNLIVVR